MRQNARASAVGRVGKFWFVHADFSFYAIAIPAVILLGLSKGGLAGVGMAATPMLATVVPPLQAAAIIFPILLVQDAITVYAYRYSWDRRNLILLLPGAAVGVAAAYLTASMVSDTAIMLIIGLVTVAFSLLQFLRRVPEEVTVRPGRLGGFLCGAASGFTSMIANAGSPPFQMYVMPQRLPPTLFVGTSAVFFGVTNYFKLIPFILLGQFDRTTLLTTALLMPLAIVSTYAGVWLIRRMSSARFYPLINGLLFAVGLRLVWSGLRGYGVF